MVRNSLAILWFQWPNVVLYCFGFYLSVWIQSLAWDMRLIKRQQPLILSDEIWGSVEIGFVAVGHQAKWYWVRFITIAVSIAQPATLQNKNTFYLVALVTMASLYWWLPFCDSVKAFMQRHWLGGSWYFSR